MVRSSDDCIRRDAFNGYRSSSAACLNRTPRVPGRDSERLAGRAALREEGLMAEDPLRGRPVALVTRPRAEAEALVPALAARGLVAVIEPLLEIELAAAPTLDLAGVQAVLCTSANGVRALARATADRRLPLYAVGEATAARARAEGFAAVTGAGGAVDDLVGLAAARLRPEGGRLLHVAGRVAAGDLAGALRGRGFAVDRANLYEARPASALSLPTLRALRQEEIGFALFFSARTAAVFVRLATEAGVFACCARIGAVVISPAVAAELTPLPWAEVRWAAHPDQPSLLAALDDLRAEASARRLAV
jgi:uroporphyrinogen-III synthase